MPNAKEGSKYLRISALNGNAEAIEKYASTLKEWNSVSVDFKETIKLYKEGIVKGSLITMISYAYMLESS